jgi:hypothetical protein
MLSGCLFLAVSILYVPIEFVLSGEVFVAALVGTGEGAFSGVDPEVVMHLLQSVAAIFTALVRADPVPTIVYVHFVPRVQSWYRRIW